MKKLKKPIEPRKPYPIYPPIKETICNKILLSFRDYYECSLEKILKIEKPPEEIFISASHDYECKCEECEFGFNVYVKEIVPNKNYKKELKEYNIKLKKYNTQLEEYNIKFKKYKLDYDEWEKIHIQKQIKLLQNKLKKSL